MNIVIKCSCGEALTVTDCHAINYMDAVLTVGSCTCRSTECHDEDCEHIRDCSYCEDLEILEVKITKLETELETLEHAS